jgi:hypothetical protein
MLNIFKDIYKVIDRNEKAVIVEDNGKMGLQLTNNSFGELILNFDFDSLSFEGNKRIYAVKGKRGGYYDYDGNCVFPLVIDIDKYSPRPYSLSEGIVFVGYKNDLPIGSRHGAINSEGRMILDIEYDDYIPFQNGHASLLRGNMIMEANTKGEIVEHDYRYINEFNDYAVDLWTGLTIRKDNTPSIGLKCGKRGRNIKF